jgi:hypothetical protein
VKVWKNSMAVGCTGGLMLFLLSFAVAHEMARMVTMLLAVVAMLVVMSLQRRKARTMCSPACICPQPAVEYVYWHGTFHSFDIHSRTFAAQFMVANAKKLVNVTEEGRQLIDSAMAVAGRNGIRDAGLQAIRR